MSLDLLRNFFICNSKSTYALSALLKFLTLFLQSTCVCVSTVIHNALDIDPLVVASVRGCLQIN